MKMFKTNQGAMWIFHEILSEKCCGAVSEKSNDSDKKDSLKRNVCNNIAKNGSDPCAMLFFNKKMPVKAIKKPVKDVNKKLKVCGSFTKH